MSQQARSPCRLLEQDHWGLQTLSSGIPNKRLMRKQALNKGMLESQGLLMEYMKEIIQPFITLNKKKTEKELILEPN